MTDLGTTEGLADSTTVAVNNNGWVLGYSSNADGTVKDPFLYLPPTTDDPAGQMIDLKYEIGASDFAQILSVTGLNDSGEIIGQGLTNEGLNDGFVMDYTPDTAATPEPSTLVSIALGSLLCVAGRRRYRMR